MGFDPGDWVVVGAPDGAKAVVALDGQFGVRDGDGHGLAGMDAAEGDLMPPAGDTSPELSGFS
ncbi:hypothetical protein ACPSM1_19145 [Micromonospora chersina]|uniref:hypothetical protein n=1 Tax=Micromonospora chersina TaxID=47854 RepID=UPI003CC101CF